MKNTISTSVFSLFLLFLFSCSSENKDNQQKTKPDSAILPNGKTAVLTDTGKLELSPVTANESNVTLYDKDGKVKSTGMYRNNEKSGAWVEYDASGKVVSVKQFARGKVQRELDKSDFEFRTWENKNFGASFYVPEKWKELPSPNASLLASFEKPVHDTAVHIPPNMNVVRAKLQAGDNIDKLAAMQLQMLHENAIRVEPPIEESKFTVDSCEAFRRFGVYTTEKGIVGYVYAVIVSGNDAWIFSCEAQNSNGEFIRYVDLFQSIVGSFHRVK